MKTRGIILSIKKTFKGRTRMMKMTSTRSRMRKYVNIGSITCSRSLRTSLLRRKRRKNEKQIIIKANKR
jgi:hypothetical protein